MLILQKYYKLYIIIFSNREVYYEEDNKFVNYINIRFNDKQC